MVRILPKPQHIEEREGILLLDYHCRITIADTCPREALFYAQQLANLVLRRRFFLWVLIKIMYARLCYEQICLLMRSLA